MLWELIVERFRNKLASWKESYLPFDCRITLIKATLAKMPIYYLSIYKISAEVAIMLETATKFFGMRRGTRTRSIW